jgi:hypothetical protein
LFGFGAWSEYKFTKEKEKTVTECQFASMDRLAEEGYNIICSDTNINPTTRSRLVQWAEDNDYEVHYKHFDVPLHILEKRNANRQYGVSPEVLVDMWQRYNKQFVPQYVADTTLPKAIIVDVDGTIAEHNGIRKPYEWNKVNLDKPRTAVIDVVKLLKKDGYKVIILSGRDGSCAELTKVWIDGIGIQFDEFLIRTAGDQRSDYVIKMELFNQVKDKYNIRFAFDDRDQVVNLWRSIGLECFQVNYGKF